jgi:hypothetical protein
MLVFWWTGRGYLTLLIPFGCGVLAAIIAGIVHLPSDTSWFAAIVFALATPINWLVGRRQNERRRKSLGLLSWRGQLVYKARHKFMSLPMETWSIAMPILAIVFATKAAAGR